MKYSIHYALNCAKVPRTSFPSRAWERKSEEKPIRDVEEKNKVVVAIQKAGKEIIDINYEQLNHFAGNMLQIENGKGEKLLVMSTQAFQSLSKEQVQKLKGYNRIIHAPLNTVEVNGGGSARCMMAEVHLPVLS